MKMRRLSPDIKFTDLSLGLYLNLHNFIGIFRHILCMFILGDFQTLTRRTVGWFKGNPRWCKRKGFLGGSTGWCTFNGKYLGFIMEISVFEKWLSKIMIGNP